MEDTSIDSKPMADTPSVSTVSTGRSSHRKSEKKKKKKKKHRDPDIVSNDADEARSKSRKHRSSRKLEIADHSAAGRDEREDKGAEGHHSSRRPAEIADEDDAGRHGSKEKGEEDVSLRKERPKTSRHRSSRTLEIADQSAAGRDEREDKGAETLTKKKPKKSGHHSSRRLAEIVGEDDAGRHGSRHKGEADVSLRKERPETSRHRSFRKLEIADHSAGGRDEREDKGAENLTKKRSKKLGHHSSRRLVEIVDEDDAGRHGSKDKGEAHVSLRKERPETSRHRSSRKLEIADHSVAGRDEREDKGAETLTKKRSKKSGHHSSRRLSEIVGEDDAGRHGSKDKGEADVSLRKERPETSRHRSSRQLEFTLENSEEFKREKDQVTVDEHEKSSSKRLVAGDVVSREESDKCMDFSDDSKEGGENTARTKSKSRKHRSSRKLSSPTASEESLSSDLQPKAQEESSLGNVWEKVEALVGGLEPLDDDTMADLESFIQKSQVTRDSNGNTEPKETSLSREEYASQHALIPTTLLDTSKYVPMEISDEPILQPISAVGSTVSTDDGEDISDEDNMDVDEESSALSDSDDDDSCESMDCERAELDIRRLATNIENGKLSTSEINSDADVVLCIGDTGVGKSTFIQAIAGHSITREWDDSLRRFTYVVDGGGESGFDIGHGMVSKTRNVRSFLRNSSNTFYVDSSGFGDTEGIETDIATSVCVKEIASRAGRLRFVVLINAYTFYHKRAGELRQNLDQITKFVGHNFNTHKKCFTFLFTHCNEAFKSVEESDDVLGAMRSEVFRLLGEVKKGTNKDRLVRSLVSFLKSSMEKGLQDPSETGFPYCDVFDPSHSDVCRIIEAVEPKTAHSSILNPSQTVLCSLTPTSKLSLAQESTERKENIARKLGEQIYDDELRKDVQALCSLSKHIEGGVCQGPVEEILSMLAETSVRTKNQLFEVARSGLTDGDKGFCMGNAEVAKSAIERLSFLEGLLSDCREALDGNSHSNDLLSEIDNASGTETFRSLLSLITEQREWMASEMTKAIELISSETAKDSGSFGVHEPDNMAEPYIDVIASKLQNLQVWAETFGGEVASEYENAKTIVFEKVMQVNNEATNENIRSSLADGPRAVRIVALLKQVREAHLLEYVLVDSSDGACHNQEKAFDFARQHAVSILSNSEEAVTTAIADAFHHPSTIPDNIDERGNRLFPSLFRVMHDIENAYRLIEKYDIQKEVEGSHFRQSASMMAAAAFIQYCDVCKRLIHANCEQIGLLRLCFQSLEVFSDSLPPLIRAEGQFVTRLQNLRGCLGAHLREVAGRMKLLVNSGQLDSSRLSETLVYHKQCLETLHSCIWFDSVLEQNLREPPFVRATFLEARDKYSSHADSLGESMKAALYDVCSTEHFTTTVQDKAASIVDRLDRLREISLVIDGRFFDEFIAIFRDQVQQMCARIGRERLNFPLSIVEVDFVGINGVLLTLKSLNLIDTNLDGSIDALLAAAFEQLKTYRNEVNTTLAIEGGFHEKGAILSASEEWSKCQLFVDCLPTWEHMRQQLRQQVVFHTKSLLKKLDAGDLSVEDHEAGTKYLREATKYIDKHIDGEASRSADTILRLLEARKISHDEELNELLESNDFKSIRKHLRSIQKSEEQGMQQLYRNCVKHLSTTLWNRFENIRSLTNIPRCGMGGSDAQYVKKRMGILDEAEAELGKAIKVLPAPSPQHMSWSLKEENEKLKKTIKVALSRSLDAAMAAVSNRNIPDAILFSQDASFLEEIAKRSSWNLRGRINDSKATTVKGKVAALIASLEDSVEDFLRAIIKSRSDFRREERNKQRHVPLFPPDTVLLRDFLSKLKPASQTPGCYDEVRDCYDKTTRRLSAELNNIHTVLLKEASECRFSRALSVFGFLREELLTRGLKEHVELNFDVVASLDDIRNQKSQQQQSMQQDLNGQFVDELAQRLKYLMQYSSGWYREDYEDARRQIYECVQKFIRETAGMIKNLDFVGLRERFRIVAQVQKKLLPHMNTSADPGDVIVSDLSSRNLTFFDDMKASIENCNLDHFQTLFIYFHGLIAEVPIADPHHKPSLLTTFDQICRTLQQKVHFMLKEQAQGSLDTFKRALESRDYADAATKAEKLRTLGYFLGSSFELYRKDCSAGFDDANLAELQTAINSHFATSEFLAIGRSFAILSLPVSATVDDVNRAFRRQSVRWHPDKYVGNKRIANEKFIAIREAQQHLEDESVLEQYRNYDFRYLVEAFTNLQTSLNWETASALKAREYDSLARNLRKLDEVFSLMAVARNPLTVATFEVEKVRSMIYNEVSNAARALLIDIENAWRRQDFTELHHSFESLEALETAFKAEKQIVPRSYTAQVLSDLDENIRKRKENVPDLRGRDESEAIREMKTFGLELISIGRILDGFPRLKKETTAVIHKILSDCHDEPWGVSFIFRLGLLLENGEISSETDDTRVGRVIVNSFPHFVDVRRVIFNREVVTAPVADSVKLIETKRFSKIGTTEDVHLDKIALENEYKEYKKVFEASFSKHVERGYDELVQEVFSILQDLGPVSISDWKTVMEPKLVQVVARVFAVFTIIKSGDSFKRFNEHCSNDDCDDDASKPMDILFRPHNIQVLAILRLLGIGEPFSPTLPNHIMEIRTGEGKSLILGALSVVLAMLGFSVRCVCYSEHLSERDNELFRDIFVAFGVEDRIIYSKIKTMSEDSVAAKGDIRKMTVSLMKGEKLTKCQQKQPPYEDRRIDFHSSANETFMERQRREGGVTALNDSFKSVRDSGATLRRNVSLLQGEGLSISSDKQSPYDGRRFGGARSADRIQEPMLQAVAESKQAAGKSIEKQERDSSTPRSTLNAPLPRNGQEILLVDEVDVFFGPDFYGKTYNQVAELEDPLIERLLRKIWQRRKDKPSFFDVRTWSEYKKIVSKFAGWTSLVETEVRSMCNDVLEFNDPPYEVDTINSRIGYSVMDSVDFELIYGYRTAFAHLNEIELGRLRGAAGEESVKRSLCMRVSCGQFSYARISPTRILGVSGTLKALSATEKEIVREFGVDTYTYVPSVYGANNLVFDKVGRGLVIETDRSRYLQTIANEIQNAVNDDRAAIVFFENDERLREFEKSPFWPRFRHGNVLSSVTDKETRSYVINKAATSGQATIASAAFGRGTDFFCKDSKLDSAGGLLVIQAFLSMEKSEQVQIMGRTARQGKKGGYMLVLLESDLCENFGIKAGDCASKSREELYDWLDKNREAVHKEKLSETCERVEQADERDKESRSYLDALVQGNSIRAKRHLNTIYEGIRNRNRKLKYCRMVCLSDATGSMTSIWGATRNCIREMLRRIDEIGEGQFELLWVAYRDYILGDQLLEKSSWTKEPKELEAFVSSIKCGGGADTEEAVEWALREVNQEHMKSPVTRALLIGDAPPHPEKRGSVLSAHNDHVLSTDYETEAEQLKRNGIPVYTFRLNNDSNLVRSFERISSITDGESCALDVSSSNGAQKLIDCVCETALEDIGGSELLAEYRARKWD